MTTTASARSIYCVGCGCDVNARLTTGYECYPHRTDLWSLPFWICDTCNNFVSCHHKTDEPTKPTGVIATPELKKARIEIHDIIDPLYKAGLITRGHLYAMLSKRLGYQYHTGEIRSMDEAKEVNGIARSIALKLKSKGKEPTQ